MSELNVPADPRVVIGIGTSDDAGVFALEGSDRVLVQTVDFITPVCDDPYWFGRVAAANSLSDIYAMGARPLTAMNICCFPKEGPTQKQYREILRGGLDVIVEAGAALVGGQSVKDEEIKYGLSVTGIAVRDELTPNSGARAGDQLILTKPLGTGVIVGGAKTGEVSQDELMMAVRRMAETNRVAAEKAVACGCRGATDITGFGLGGHAWEMAEASGVRLVLNVASVPVYESAISLLRSKLKAGTVSDHVDWKHGNIVFEGGVPPELQHVSADPQTSGGLLIAIAADRADDLMAALRGDGLHDAAVVGQAESGAAAVIIRH